MSEHHPSPAPDHADGAVRHELRSEVPLALAVRNGRGDLDVATTDGPDVIVEMSSHHAETQEILRNLPVEIIDGRLQIDLPRNDLGGVTASVGDLLKAAGEGLRSGSLSDRISHGVDSLTRGVSGSVREVDIRVRVPHHSSARLSTGAGDVRAQGAWQDLHVATGAGDVQAGSTGERCHVATGAGDVHLGESAGEVWVKAGTGDVQVARALRGRITVKTGAGDCVVRVAEGTAVHVDAASGVGERRIDLTPTDGSGEAEDTLEISLRSGTGDLTVTRA